MAAASFSNEILIDLNGNRAYLGDSLWVYSSPDTTTVQGTLWFPTSDLGEPEVDKYLNGFSIDYAGDFNVFFTIDGEDLDVVSLDAAAIRSVVWKDIPLVDRKPFRKLGIILITSTINSVFYGLELDIDTSKRRKDS